MEKEEFTKEILHTIDEQKLTPTARWHVVLKNSFLWVFVAVALVFAASAVSTKIFMVLEHDWEIFELLERSFLEHILISIPYFWIVMVFLLTTGVLFSFSRTKRAYRYEFSTLIMGSVLASFGLGAAFYAIGLDSEIHNLFSKHLPFYDRAVYTKEDIWIFPEQGLLSGEIMRVESPNEFLLRDFSGKEWQVQGSDPIWEHNLGPRKGVQIKLIGTQYEDNVFSPKIIKAWGNK